MPKLHHKYQNKPDRLLDSQTRELLMDDLLDLWTREGFTGVYVTHNLGEAVRMGHKIVVLSRRPGRIRNIVDIDIALDCRNNRLDELNAIQAQLWAMMREEALAADQELIDG